MPIHVVAQRLGHDPAMLLRVYAHAGDGSQDVAAGLEGLLDGSPPELRVVPGRDEEPERFVTKTVTTRQVEQHPRRPDLPKRWHATVHAHKNRF